MYCSVFLTFLFYSLACLASPITFRVTNEGLVLDPSEYYSVSVRFKALEVDPLDTSKKCFIEQADTLDIPDVGYSNTITLPPVIKDVRVLLGLRLRHSPTLKPLGSSLELPIYTHEIHLVFPPTSTSSAAVKVIEADSRTSH